ncbi:gluconokinase [Robiginitalea sp. SC105]|uniref:gluconokinase n=1 Tax=Robiginitalea sp. SC105 TaxID=2762332 RepID=UPI00163AA931|nr:gluconokinase [Robiginitalea sp. SC105]MBC2840758.1 gluconokinase [Robiginitalea sp. SC105]
MGIKLPKILFVMGVSASGKSTLAEALAADLGRPYFDADDFHPPANIEKMSAGHPLDDSDRKGWLDSLNALARAECNKNGAVITCSALKEKYRQRLVRGLAPKEVEWVVLTGSIEDIGERIRKRTGHYMPPSLLQSQFADLEVPQYGIHLPACGLEIPEMVARVRARLKN